MRFYGGIVVALVFRFFGLKKSSTDSPADEE